MTRGSADYSPPIVNETCERQENGDSQLSASDTPYERGDVSLEADKLVLLAKEKERRRELVRLVSMKIEREIDSSPYVSIIVNTITDVTNKTVHALVFRYITIGNSVKERIYKICSGEKALLEVMKEWFAHNDVRKLVSLSYDGGVKVDILKAISKVVDKESGDILEVHSCDHVLSTVIQQVLLEIPSCKSFFQTVTGLALFLWQSRRRRNAYFTAAGKTTLDRKASTMFSTALLTDLSVRGEKVEELLRSMANDGDDWDALTRIGAEGFYRTMYDFEFMFLLKTFTPIQVGAEELHRFLNGRLFFDGAECRQKIIDFIDSLERLSRRFDDVLESSIRNYGRNSPTAKKIKLSPNRERYKRLYSTIHRKVFDHVIHRFADVRRLSFLNLLDHRMFQKYNLEFPEEHMRCLASVFGSRFDNDKLKSQLTELYHDTEFHKSSCQELFAHLKEKGRPYETDELTKFVAAVLIMPIVKAEGLSGTSKINSYLVNSRKKLTDYSLVSIENDLSHTIQTPPDPTT